MWRIKIILIFCTCFNLFAQKEIEFNKEGMTYGPVGGMKKPNSTVKSNSIDSTFVFSSDTLDLPIFDDFSTHKFQEFQGVFGAPGTTSQMFYRLIDASTNLAIPPGITYTNQVTFRRTYDLASGNITDLNFPALGMIENNLTVYPPTGNPINLYPPYYIYDTVGVPDISDTIWISNPAYFQDSAIVFFQTISDTNKIWINRMAYHNYRYGLNPRSLGIATFDGLDENGYPYQFGSNVTNYGDFLTSKSIDLSGYDPSDSLYLSFLYQPEGLGDIPESGDSLILEFYASALDQWIHIWSTPGTGVHPFKSVHIPIRETEFFNNGFKMRFKNYGALSGSLDHFHIDFVHLRPLSSFNDTLFKDFALSYPVQSALQKFTSAPWDHYKNSVDNKMNSQLQIKVHNGSNSAENYQNGQIEIRHNGLLEGGFSLPGFILAEGNINYNPSSLFTSYHDLTTGYEYNRNLTGNYQEFSIKSTVSAQFPNALSNDTSNCIQGFYNYYSYDDGSAEAAFGPTGAQSMMAVHFNAYESDSLLGVYLHFVPSVTDVSNKLFYITVWEDNNGVPGNVLYEDDAFSPRQPTYANGLNNFNAYYFLDNAKIPVNNSFFIGWRQVDALRYNLGLDRNNDQSNEIYYSVDFGATWDNPTFPGSAMLRPIFSTQLDEELNIPAVVTPPYLAYPNPTSGLLTIQSPFDDEQGYLFLDLQGRLICKSDNAILNLKDLQDGYYIVKSLKHPQGSFKILKRE